MKNYLTISFNKAGGVTIGDTTIMVYRENSKTLLVMSSPNEINRMTPDDPRILELIVERQTKRDSETIDGSRYPTFVKLKSSCLRLRYGNKYWRDNGNWSVGFRVEEGRLFSVSDMDHLDNIELIRITRDEWQRDNARIYQSEVG